MHTLMTLSPQFRNGRESQAIIQEADDQIDIVAYVDRTSAEYKYLEIGIFS